MREDVIPEDMINEVNMRREELIGTDFIRFFHPGFPAFSLITIRSKENKLSRTFRIDNTTPAGR